jgi:hypothetical protein
VDKPKHQNAVISRALETFLHRTCAICKKRLFYLGPCEHCGDGSHNFRISYEDIPENWRECEFRISLVERGIGDKKRSYTHKKSGRKDLELRFRKKVGGDGRIAYEVLLFDRMKRCKRHTVHVLIGETFSIEHDEDEPL